MTHLQGVGLHDLGDVQRAVSESLVELRDDLVAQTVHGVHESGLVYVQLAVFELTLQLFLGEGGLTGIHLFQRLTYLGAGTPRLGHIEPVLLGHLIDVRHDFHLFAALQLVA